MKKNLPAILLFITVFCINAHSQQPTLIWAKSTTSQVSPGTQIINTSTAVTTDALGNLFVTGYFYGTSDFDPGAGVTNLTSAGGEDIFLAKYDASGALLWAKSIGGTGDDAAYSMVSDGTGVIITGTYIGTVDFDPSAGVANLTGSGLHNSFIAEFDLNGNLTMARGLNGADVYSAAVTRDLTGNIYIAGYFQGTVDFDPSTISTVNLVSAGGTDIFIAKYSSLGALVWVKGIGGAGADGAQAINLDPLGKLYVSGYFGSNDVDFDAGAGTAVVNRQGYYDGFLTQYDENGNFVWAGGIGGAGGGLGGSTVFARALTSDASGILVTGSFNGTTDFDPGASTANLVSGGSTDAFIARYNSNGTYGWAINISGSGPDESFAITTDSKSNIYIAGYLGGPADFDPGPGTANVFPSGFDIYMAKYDATGNYIWGKDFGSSSNSDVGSALTIDVLGNLYMSGTFTGTIDFDPGPGVTNLSTSPVGVLYNGDIFIGKYTTGTVLPVHLVSFTGQLLGKSIQLNWSTANELNNQKFIVERSADGEHFSQIAQVAGKGTSSLQNNYSAIDITPLPDVNYYRLKQVDADGVFAYSRVIAISVLSTTDISVYPNPSSSQLNVRFATGSFQTVQLINNDGKILASEKTSGGNVYFNIQQLPAGTYYVRLSGTSGTINRKVIKK